MRPMAILAVLAMAAAAAQAAPAAMTLTQFIAAADAAEPLSRSKLQQMLGDRLRCQADEGQSCEARGVVFADRTVGSLSLRRGDKGSLLVLDDLSGPCLPLEPLRSRFHLDALTQACTDGAICLYWTGPRPWGEMSLGVGDDGPGAACITSVVLDSMRN